MILFFVFSGVITSKIKCFLTIYLSQVATLKNSLFSRKSVRKVVVVVVIGVAEKGLLMRGSLAFSYFLLGSSPDG